MTAAELHEHSQSMADSLMMYRRVLISLPPSKKERTRCVLGFLQQAKVNWELTVDAVCPRLDQRGFEPLVLPNGRFFFPPHLLRPQAWEKDPEAVGLVEQQIKEAELAAGLPIGRFMLGAGHTVGRAFSARVRVLRRYALVRKVLADNSEPFVIIRRLFHFADEVLAKCKPDFVCAYEYATVLNGSLWLAAKRRHIPCVSIRFSKIDSGGGFWSLDRKMLNTAALDRGTNRRQTETPVSNAAKAKIQAFRECPATVAYIANKWRGHDERGFFRWHVLYARTMLRELVNRARGQDRALAEPFGSRLARYYWQQLMAYRQQRFLQYFDEETLANMKYVYFPMHKEAELAQTVQATQWYDQRNTIRVLASMLPFGYRLLAREHRLNYGHRPTSYYRELLQIPNVVLIDPFDSQFKYLRNADLIVTENGSSGWEGLLLRRRVLLLSDTTFYDGSGLGVRAKGPEKLNEEILRILNEPAVADFEKHDHSLGCAIDAELETTFRMTAEGTSAAVDRLAATIGPVLREHHSPSPAISGAPMSAALTATR
jgi:hypothetical protein